jgi:hypothetical protein
MRRHEGRSGRLRWLPLVAVAVLAVSGCGDAGSDDEATTAEPATVEPVEGGEVNRITLTARAAERLGVDTAVVAAEPPVAFGAPARTSIPYAAVIYDPAGQTWTYVSPEPNTFERQAITVEDIRGAVDDPLEQMAVLALGPPAGTTVVTDGAAELFGTEYEVGH